MNKKIHMITAPIAVVIIVALSFYLGMNYGKGQNTKPSFANGNFQGARNARGGNFISGDIISKDNNSITVQLPTGSGSKIIFYSGTTQINKSASGTADDLSKGTSVSVTGTTNSDGSITAQSIQIRPARPTQPTSAQ